MIIAFVVFALVAPVLGATQSPDHAAGLLEKHRYAEAKSMFTALQRGDPRSAVFAYSLGRIAQHRGDSAAARARYTDALALDPHSTPARKALADLK